MSNLTTILEVAGNTAFTNLFEVEVGTAQSVKNTFRLYIENIQIPSMNLNFAIENSTKKNYIQSASKIRELKLRIRETGVFYFYEYLLSWYKDFYDPITNRFKSGDSTNSGIKSEIVKKRILSVKAYTYDENHPPFILSTTSAMLQNQPSLNLDYSSSRPITYDVTFIVDNINITAGTTYLGTTNSLSTTKTSATTPREETMRDWDKYSEAQAAK